jgi:hypothetical protein
MQSRGKTTTLRLSCILRKLDGRLTMQISVAKIGGSAKHCVEVPVRQLYLLLCPIKMLTFDVQTCPAKMLTFLYYDSY